MAAGSTQILPAAGHIEPCRVFQRRQAGQMATCSPARKAIRRFRHNIVMWP